MTTSIGHRGVLELFAADAGPKHKVKIVSFVGLSAAGGVEHADFDATMQPVAVLDLNDGSLRTSEFSDTGNTQGTLTQTDTGPSGHVCWAIYTDTGV